MKRYLLLIILLLPIVSAKTILPPEKLEPESWTSKEEFNCNVCCIENDKFSLTTTITNNGTETLWIGNAKLIDKDNKEFASYKTSDPNFRYSLQPEKSMNIKYEGKWPKPSIKNSLFYKQCLYIGTFGKWECEDRYKEKIIAKSIDFQCYKDEDCSYDKICNIEDCIISKCETIPIAKSCGRIARGDWRTYECCLDQDCKEDQHCLDHNCEQVECVDCGYIYDHKCVEFECCDIIACGLDQVCLNKKCVKIECGYCEYIDERMCKEYECCEDVACEKDKRCIDNKCERITCEKGYIEEHSCIEYKCTIDEDCREDLVCEEGFCKKLKCKEEEVIKEHKCEEFISLFGYVKGHRYVSYFSKEAYQDNKKTYTAIFILIILLIARLGFSKAKNVVKESKRRKSYIPIKPKKTKQ